MAQPSRPLEPGERVAVIAPSSPIRPEMLEEGLGEVRRLGYAPEHRGDVAARWRFSAGDDARRLAELRWALEDPSVRCAWMARGGYGLTPLLGRLDMAALLAASPRPFIGESDATALGCLLLAAGLEWIHGPMVAGSLRQGSEGYDEPSLRAALESRGHRVESALVTTLSSGRAEGVLWGGCLSLLAALCGTPWLPRIDGALLVVEDVGVKPYQVHRMLVQLRDAGALTGLRGVLLGDFSDCVQHAEQGYDVADVMLDLFRDAAGDVPVTIGWPVGHAAAPHLSLPMGRAAVLDARSPLVSLDWEPGR